MFFHISLKYWSLSASEQIQRFWHIGNSVTLLLQYSRNKVVFKVFEQRSVELVGAFRIWHGKLFTSSTVQKPDWRRFEESKRGSLKKQSISNSGGEKWRSWGREERRGKERSGTLAHKNQYYNNINWRCSVPYVMPYGKAAPEACYNRQPAAVHTTWHIYKQGTSH